MAFQSETDIRDWLDAMREMRQPVTSYPPKCVIGRRVLNRASESHASAKVQTDADVFALTDIADHQVQCTAGRKAQESIEAVEQSETPKLKTHTPPFERRAAMIRAEQQEKHAMVSAHAARSAGQQYRLKEQQFNIKISQTVQNQKKQETASRVRTHEIRDHQNKKQQINQVWTTTYDPHFRTRGSVDRNFEACCRLKINTDGKRITELCNQDHLFQPRPFERII